MRQLAFLFISVLLLSGSLFAAAGELDSLQLEFAADTMLVRLDYSAFLTDDDAAALDQGEDLVLSVNLELWQNRSLWFDRLRRSLATHFLLHYDRWQECYTLSPRGAEDWLEPIESPQFTTLLDSLQAAYPHRLSLTSEDFQRKSYIVYTVEVRYATPEKLNEIASWLVGGGDNNSKSLPNKALGFLVNSTGIKNRSYLQNSENFLPADRPSSVIFRR